MLTLVDARQGRELTGIGQYIVNLLQEFGAIAPESVRPICWRQQRDRFTDMGLRPWSPWRGRLYKDGLLPRADVVHGPDFVAPRHRSATRVATIHDLSFIRFPERFPKGFPEALDARIRSSLSHTPLFLCVSAATRDEVIDHYGLPEHRTRVIHLGVAPAFGADVDERAVETTLDKYGLRRPFLLHVGALVPRKDVGTLLEAYAAVRSEVDSLGLVLAGPSASDWGSDLPRITEWRERNPKLAQDVRVTGYVADEDLPHLFRAAAACVSTSLWEGFGLTVLQALAAGCPAIAARVGAVPEFGGNAVWFAGAGDAGSFAEAIFTALSRTHERDVMLAAGQTIATKFSWRVTAEKTLEAYRDAARA